MTKVGLTGGIGSGKSLISGVLESLGYPVYYADLRGRWLTDNHLLVIKGFKEIFGEKIYNEGRLDRASVAWRVFKDRALLDQINAIVHPVVANDFDTWCSTLQQNHLVFKEAAIMFESGSNKRMDKIICVSAPQEIRIQRVVERDGVSEEQVVERIKNQMDDDERQKLSDYVITNDGKLFVIPQVLDILKRLMAVAEENQKK